MIRNKTYKGSKLTLLKKIKSNTQIKNWATNLNL